MIHIKSNLIETVSHLSGEIGRRSYLDIGKLGEAADYIDGKFRSFGCPVARQPFAYSNNTYYNLDVEVPGSGGRDEGILIVGAHYDTVPDTPGADDNASGVAGLLELARLASLTPFRRTARFVAFCLEEPPAFMTSRMGSHLYAQRVFVEGTRVHGMISLEMLGYYCQDDGCQYYPSSLFRLFYPKKGDYIAFVGNISSRRFTREVRDSFRAVSSLAVESLSGISLIPGVDFSDHRSFWKFGYPAFMVTDTAFYRNPNYHAPGDTAETLDYEKMSALVEGLYKALREI
ncbi:MAG: M28 family peptidase [Candidatus Sulfobium sp.]|jgi:Zn-dependent M28 family amino/carboxypeptidase